MHILCFVIITLFFQYNICKARLSSYDRIAVKLEAYYALSDTHKNGTSENYKNRHYFGDWNYIASDKNAYNYVKSKLGGCSSNWTKNKNKLKDLRPPSPYGCCNNNCNYCNDVDFYSNIDDYGYANNTGRKGQCKYFAHLIYKRAIGEESIPSYESMSKEGNSEDVNCFSKNIHVGDFIFRTDDHHCAIVTDVIKNDKNNIKFIKLIESNWFDPGDNRPKNCEPNSGPSCEAISIRNIYPQEANNYKIWTNNCVYRGDCAKPPSDNIHIAFLLDTSGSMKGKKLNKAKQAAAISEGPIKAHE